MTSRIIEELKILRDAYALYLVQTHQFTQSSYTERDMVRAAISELDTQIAARTEEQEQEGPPLHCDVTQAKRYMDAHEQ